MFYTLLKKVKNALNMDQTRDLHILSLTYNPHPLISMSFLEEVGLYVS